MTIQISPLLPTHPYVVNEIKTSLWRQYLITLVFIALIWMYLRDVCMKPFRNHLSSARPPQSVGCLFLTTKLLYFHQPQFSHYPWLYLDHLLIILPCVLKIVNTALSECAISPFVFILCLRQQHGRLWEVWDFRGQRQQGNGADQTWMFWAVESFGKRWLRKGEVNAGFSHSLIDCFHSSF